MAKFNDVEFEFLSLAKDVTVGPSRGAVILRDREMMLEIEYHGERPYNIRGNATGNFFSGRHEGIPGHIQVNAKWTRLDDIYIGTWVEEGREFVFKFRLPEEED